MIFSQLLRSISNEASPFALPVRRSLDEAGSDAAISFFFSVIPDTDRACHGDPATARYAETSALTSRESSHSNSNNRAKDGAPT